MGLVEREPLQGFDERFTAKVATVASALRHPLHQPRTFEPIQVLRNGRTGYWKGFRKGTNRARTPAEEPKDFASCWIGERPKDLVKPFR